MNCANIIILGKTGSGKSTLVNAIVQDKVAPTGKGGAFTRENKIYSCEREVLNSLSRNEKWKFKVYDTVGLELDEKITEKTLKDVEHYLKATKQASDDKDILIVWLCINHRCHKFEQYELDVVDKMSLKYEVPFSILLTQCIEDEESEIERQLNREYSEIHVRRILAEDYNTRLGVFPAYGVDDAIREAICDYNESMVNILESKLEYLCEERNKRIKEIENKGKESVEKHGKIAGRIGIIPGGCIPFVHGICIKMLMELNHIAGIDDSRGFATDIFVNTIVGLMATPFMAVPLLSALTAGAYVQASGESYLEALLAVIERSTDEELKNNDKMAERIRGELKKRKG